MVALAVGYVVGKPGATGAPVGLSVGVSVWCSIVGLSVPPSTEGWVVGS